MVKMDFLENFACDADEVNAIEVRAWSEDVRVEKGSGQGIEITQLASKSYKESADMRVEGRTLVIRSRAGNVIPVFSLGGSSAIAISIPSSWDGELYVKSASGDISAYNTAISKATFETKSGDVTVRDFSCADISAGTFSGDVRLSGLSCSTISGTTKSGDIDMQGTVKEDVHLRTISGDVQFDGRAREVLCQSTSGDIRGQCVSVTRLEGTSKSGDIEFMVDSPVNLEYVECSSISGDVKLALPERTVINLSFTSVSGSLNTKKARQLVIDTMNGIRVNLNTVSGDGVLRSIPYAGVGTAYEMAPPHVMLRKEMNDSVDYI